MLEEVGQHRFDVGPQIWQRAHHFFWAEQQYFQAEQIFLVPVTKFLPTGENNPDQGEIAVFNGFQWWPLAEIEQSTEIFVPRQLAMWLRQLIKNGPPEQPIEVGI